METEYDKLVSIKTKGELNGFDKNLGLTLNVKINSLDTELCNFWANMTCDHPRISAEVDSSIAAATYVSFTCTI